jgi:hypothetical protein
VVAQLEGDVLRQLGDTRLRTQQSLVRIRLHSQSPERGQEI